MPSRVETDTVPGLMQKRNSLRIVHIIIGVITALIIYPACIITGPIRPKVAKKRINFIWAHTVLGYFTVALASEWPDVCAKIIIVAYGNSNSFDLRLLQYWPRTFLQPVSK